MTPTPANDFVKLLFMELLGNEIPTQTETPARITQCRHIHLDDYPTIDEAMEGMRYFGRLLSQQREPKPSVEVKHQIRYLQKCVTGKIFHPFAELCDQNSESCLNYPKNVLEQYRLGLVEQQLA